MAIIVGKEEIENLGSNSGSVGNTKLDYILQFLNNPIIQEIILRIFNRFFPSQQVQQMQIQQQQQLNGEKLFLLIYNFLNSFEKTLTIEELLKNLEMNKNEIVQTFERFLK